MGHKFSSGLLSIQLKKVSKKVYSVGGELFITKTLRAQLCQHLLSHSDLSLGMWTLHGPVGEMVESPVTIVIDGEA